ncbi:MAG: molybdenum cofactor biosynthesis protein MoaE [Leptospirales bacterium]
MYITEKSIDLDALISEADSSEIGGLVIFIGKTRNVHNGKGVSYLEYEVQKPMAEKSMEEIVVGAKNKWNLTHASAMHRVGRVNIGEASVVIITASAHRKEAYEANRFILDTIKAQTPVWKKEFYTDGSNTWK